MDTRDFWVYLAGFLDGEGCFGIYRQGPCLQVSSTDPDILFWILDRAGVGSIVTERKRNPNHKDVTRWNVTTGGLRILLPKVLPYLRVKEPQALVLMEYLEGMKVNNGRRLAESELERRQGLVGRLHALNARGKAHVGVVGSGNLDLAGVGGRGL